MARFKEDAKSPTSGLGTPATGGIGVCLDCGHSAEGRRSWFFGTRILCASFARDDDVRDCSCTAVIHAATIIDNFYDRPEAD